MACIGVQLRRIIRIKLQVCKAVCIQLMELVSAFQESAGSHMRSPSKLLAYMVTLCISEFYFGYTLIYLSAVRFEVIAKVFNIDYDLSVAEGIFQGVMPIGGAIGAVSSSYFISVLSRKHVLYLFNAVSIVLAVASLYPDYRFLLLVRLLQGGCCGLFSATIPLIIKQNSPSEVVNITGGFSNLFIIVGLFFLYLFGFVLGVATGDQIGYAYWKIVFLFPVLLQVLQVYLLMAYFPYQTPKYLAHNGKTEELKQLLEEFYKPEYVQNQYDEVIKHHGRQANDTDETAPRGYRSKSALFFAIFYAFLCPMVGINVIMSYGGEVASHVMPSLRAIMPAVLMFLYLVFSSLSLIYVGRYGRKTLTMAGTIGIVLGLLVISFAYFISSSNTSLAQRLIVIALVWYLFVYGLTYAPVMWIWVAQALQPQLVGYAIMVNWSGAALVMIFFPILLEHLPGHNPAYVFLFFAVYGTLSLLVTSRFMVETKDKKQHEIAEEYKQLDEEYFGKEEAKDLEMKLIKEDLPK